MRQRLDDATCHPSAAVLFWPNKSSNHHKVAHIIHSNVPAFVVFGKVRSNNVTDPHQTVVVVVEYVET